MLISQLAGQSLYRRALKAGVQIYEYQPQILHAKLIIVDDAVYVGSANLDPRSLNINYELMIRFERREMAEQARAIFARTPGALPAGHAGGVAAVADDLAAAQAAVGLLAAGAD